MEVASTVRFPKIFSPRVLIRDSSRVNDFNIRSRLEPATLTLSVQCWQSPIKDRLQAFAHHRVSGSGVESCDYSYLELSQSPKPSEYCYVPQSRSYSCRLPESRDEFEKQTTVNAGWNWTSEGPQDLSLSGTNRLSSPARWEDRSDGLHSPADLSKTSNDIHGTSIDLSKTSGRHKGKVKIFKCPYCVITCSNRGQLLGHIRIHTGERPFVCQEPGCKKAFIRNEELTRHRRIHTGERPYVCETCKKAFTRKDHLNKHVKIHTTADDIFAV